jgi:tRNA threonylcarbamoyladenosine biosynthesis protein TsaB
LKALGLDTSTGKLAIGVVVDDSVVVEKYYDLKDRMCERLPAVTTAVLKKAGINIGVLDMIVMGAGPGSFTGLRIGLSFARGLAFQRNIPVRTIPLLDAIANSPMLETVEESCVIIPARRDQFYFRKFRRNPSLFPLCEPGVETIGEIVGNLSAGMVLAGPVIDDKVTETIISSGREDLPDVRVVRATASLLIEMAIKRDNENMRENGKSDGLMYILPAPASLKKRRKML